jgi:alginate O-acetyltransferase complex protein AlgI
MQFDSLAFVVFLAVVWLVYQLTPRHRWLVLAMASLGFYATLRAPLLLLALALVVVVSHRLGLLIVRRESESGKLRMLWIGVAVNIAILCLIKYLQPIAVAICPSLVLGGRQANLFVTIGVSYFTLQAISYLADVYLEKAAPEPRLGRFALYLGFFPKLLQGPIERAGDLLPQLNVAPPCNYDNLRSGALLFAWGLFKKVAVANRLALYVNTVYGDVHSYGGVSLLMATYMYALQIYADFSGYTDMALGAARMFDIRLTQNFNAPYLATSVADFWRRWHISFSRWILDYIFRPLQALWRGGRNYGTAAALLITFLFSGLWHGAAWGFVIWGLLHGLYLGSSVFYRPWATRMFQKMGIQNHPVHRSIQTVVTFHLVCLAWIFFRAGSAGDGWYVLTHLFSGVGIYAAAVFSNFRDLLHHKELWDPILLGKTLPKFLLLLTSLMVMLLASLWQGRLRIQERPAWVRWPVYYVLAAATAFLSVYDNVGFVYFQF